MCLTAASASAQERAQSDSTAITQPPNDTPRHTSDAFRWRQHPSLRFGDAVRLEFRARLAIDDRRSDVAFPGSDPASSDVTRERVSVSGVVAKVAEFQIEGDLGRAAWRDVFANYRQFDRVEVQAGRFKVPFGLDQNTSSSSLDFVYRSRAATTLSPGRDRGGMVHGRVTNVRYAVGVFAHDGDNSRGSDVTRVQGNRTLAGRLTVEPAGSSRSVFEDVQVSVGYTMSDVPEGIADLRGRTQLGETFFAPAYYVRGARRRVGVDARWRPGPFSLQSEYIRLTSQRLHQGLAGDDLHPLVASAWYVSGTWIATGERKKKGAQTPKRPLFAGGIGAIEFAARVEAVGFASDGEGLASTSPRADTIAVQRDRIATFGMNWFPNRWIKVQANVVRDVITAPVTSVFAPPAAYWSRIVRVQLGL